MDDTKFNFLWVIEFPQFEWSEEDGRYYAMHHPFTSPMDEDLDLLDTDQGKVRAKAYDIVLNGNEIGGGSIRIHSPEVQEKMFEKLGFTKEEAWERFGFLALRLTAALHTVWTGWLCSSPGLPAYATS